MQRLGEDERGSASVEFVLVGTLLTLLTLAVVQLGLAVYVRNIVHDAAVDGAYHAALADRTPADGAERTAQILARSVGALDAHTSAVHTERLGMTTVEVRVVATLPLVGLFGIPAAMEVTGHAPVEAFD